MTSHRVALVTGATEGIGRAVAFALGRAGWSVGVCARTPDRLERLLLELRGAGIHADGLPADVGNEAQVKALTAHVGKVLGPIDTLVNNAGVLIARTISDLSIEDWDATMRTNVRSLFLVTREVLPGMRAAGRGDIVNVASLAGKNGFVGGTAYVASKHAVLGFSKALMLEERKNNIRVIAVCPGIGGHRDAREPAAAALRAGEDPPRRGCGRHDPRHAAAARSRAGERDSTSGPPIREPYSRPVGGDPLCLPAHDVRQPAAPGAGVWLDTSRNWWRTPAAATSAGCVTRTSSGCWRPAKLASPRSRNALADCALTAITLGPCIVVRCDRPPHPAAEPLRARRPGAAPHRCAGVAWVGVAAGGRVTARRAGCGPSPWRHLLARGSASGSRTGAVQCVPGAGGTRRRARGRCVCASCPRHRHP